MLDSLMFCLGIKIIKLMEEVVELLVGELLEAHGGKAYEAEAFVAVKRILSNIARDPASKRWFLNMH